MALGATDRVTASAQDATRRALALGVWRGWAAVTEVAASSGLTMQQLYLGLPEPGRDHTTAPCVPSPRARPRLPAHGVWGCRSLAHAEGMPWRAQSALPQHIRSCSCPAPCCFFFK